MAHLVDNTFSSYFLTEDEETEGSILSITQRQLLQNDLATCAEEKLRLEFDPAEPQLFIQQEAFKKGQIELIQYMLDRSESAIESRAQPQQEPNQ